MAEPSEEDFANYLMQLLQQGGGRIDTPAGPVSDPVIAPRQAFSPAERRSLRTPFENPARQIGQSLADPLSTRPRSPGEAGLDIAGAAAAPISGPLAGILKQLGPKIMQVVARHPKETMALLASLGMTTGARGAGESEFGDEGKPTEGQTTRLNDLNREIGELQKWLDNPANSQTKETVSPHGYTTKKGTADSIRVGKVAEKAEKEREKAELQKTIESQYNKYQEASRPWEERNPWAVPGALGVSAIAGGAAGSRNALNLARRGEELSHLGSFTNAAWAAPLGLFDAAMSVGVPKSMDLAFGTKKAKEEARKNLGSGEWWTGAPVAETLSNVGMSATAAKVMNELMSLWKTGTSPTARSLGIGTGGPSGNIVQQLQNNDLNRTFRPPPRPAAPAVAAPPVVAPPAVPRNMKYNKLGRPYDPGAPGNPTVHGVPYRPPRTAANPRASQTKQVPAETVVPTESDNPTIRTLLRNMGTKPGPEGGFMGEPEK